MNKRQLKKSRRTDARIYVENWHTINDLKIIVSEIRHSIALCKWSGNLNKAKELQEELNETFKESPELDMFAKVECKGVLVDKRLWFNL